MIRLACLAAFACLAMILAACAGAPPERFYSLIAEPLTAAPVAATAASPGVSVGPVTVPEAVDRPQIVVRVGANQVAVVEGHRWDEPLKQAIARVVAANLSRGGLAAVTSRQAAAQDTALRVTIDVQRFESVPGDSVTLEAVWSVRRTSGAEVRAGHSVLREPCASAGYNALAAAHSLALAKLSEQIAAAIEAMQATSR